MNSLAFCDRLEKRDVLLGLCKLKWIYRVKYSSNAFIPDFTDNLCVDFIKDYVCNNVISVAVL